LPEYFGDPYTGCKPECVVNDDCPQDKACVRNKCTDPCVGICGYQANCAVRNHLALCTCQVGFTGNAYQACYRIRKLILPRFWNV
jgi:hypothetical protein